MIGEAYFDLRERLGKDLFLLAQVVREHGGTADDVQILENLVAGLNDPFVFVVVGEVNVGKSTFLNALFGAEFSRTGVMPTTDKIYFFKHGPVVQSTPIAPTVEEVRVPCDFLKNFHIVDTPGTNSIEGEHQQITEKFVPAADLVVFVFSALNPWGASAWQFLDKVHRQWMRHVIFVLQQCDLRTPEELQVITDYMRQLCQQRFGREFPLFPVSAKKAFLARSSGIDRERLMAESGYEALEGHINQVVTQQPARLGKLGASVRLARQVLDQIMERTTATLDLIRKGRALIDEMQGEREVQVERTKGKFQLAVEASDFDFREAASRIVALADEGLTPKAAFKLKAEDTRIPKNLDHKLYQDLLASAGERWQQMAHILEDDFKRFENYMAHHWRGELYLGDLKAHEENEPASQEARRRFTAKVDSTLRRFVLGLKIDESLEPGLLRTRTQARRLPVVAGVLGLLAVVAGLLFGWQMGLGALAVASMIGLVMYALLGRALRNTRDHLVEHFEQARPSLTQMLQEQVRDETENAFGLFTRILQPSREDLELQETRIHQQLAKLFELKQSLQKLAQELQAGSASA
ncbi:MAG: dynamin family protein [Verrucomicrobiaceae bacterium]|nr:dynamin family protein [Verrucomicrobiaceae bacterium]